MTLHVLAEKRWQNATMPREPKETTPITVRLPQALKEEADGYARSVGVSLSGLLGLALRDFMDGRSSRTPLSALPSSPAAPAGPVPTPGSKPASGGATFKPPASRSAPCPCGATDHLGHRLKWKHCHGQKEE